MRHLVLGLCVLTASSGAYAQNYLPARDYSGPTTIVNMDVLQHGGYGGHANDMMAYAPYAPAPVPVLSMPLPPPAAAPAPLYAHVPSPMPLPMAQPVGNNAPMPIMPNGVAPMMQTSDLGALPLAGLPPADLVEPQAPRMPVASVQDLPPPSASGTDSSFAPIRTVAVPAVPQKSASAPVLSQHDVFITPSVADTQRAIQASPPAKTLIQEKPYQVASLNHAPTVPSPVMPQDRNAAVHAGIADMTASVSNKPAAEDDFEAYRLLFDAGSSELKPDEKTVLNNVIAKMKSDPAIRLRMQSYAAGTPETTGQARRLSLARAMKIRTYMTENGIVPTRLDVRALGMGSTSMNDTVARSKAPADRVDVIFMRG